ncbi:MAG: DNA polymerase III subunit gamma/tau [Polyangiaceae bacterium]
MSYLVLARKYRPQTFADLVGQEHVTRTLANAMSSGRVAHAFLFTGVRGVGKTTSARLLAKCLNCVGVDAVGSAPAPTPCNLCAPCREITAGQDLDVQEIDGASYNGVDEVRRLQDGMSFRPARDRYKIYVVDEVHMLSNAAWNAFLKTLEEPPPHVKFVFATTEVHKVPVTILSRCQRYDFKLISTQAIAARLHEVLASEHIEADAAAVQILAREASGSMRDAMSLLDQVIAYSGAKLGVEDVTRVLGVADRKVLHELAGALVAGNAPACLAIVDRISREGFDLPHVARDILWHLRGLVVARVCSRGGDGPSLKEMLDVADEELSDVTSLAERSDPDDLSRLFQGFSRAFDDISRSGQPRLALEMALIRLARRPPLLPLDELLVRIGDLERRLQSPPSGPQGGGGGARAPRPVAPSSGGRESPGPSPVERSRGVLGLVDPRGSEPEAPPAPADVIPIVRKSRPPAMGPQSSPATVASAEGSWRAVIDRVRSADVALASTLEHAVVMEIGPQKLAVGFDSVEGFLAERASAPAAIAKLTRAAREHFGSAVEVTVRTSVASAATVPTIASVDAERKAAEIARARAAVEEHPLVREATRVFGARVREVKLPSMDE